jgi:linoleoyl-CoA desaturase
MSKVTFNNSKATFFPNLKKEVDQYFIDNNIKKTGNFLLYSKSAILIPLAFICYFVIILAPLTMWQIILVGALLGLTKASIGFNVMHDACHGSFSTKKWVNELFGYSMILLGSNQFIWKQKHNIVHHTYTNIDGIDDDIAKSPLIRQCQTQKWVPAHRVQHLYLPFVYFITSFAWTFIMDFTKYFSKKIYTTPLQKMDAKEHTIFWLSKVFYVAVYIVIPIYVIGGKGFAAYFLSMHLVLGFMLAIVFQLAHVVEETEFEVATTDSKVIENEFAIHQVKTTANFAMNSGIVNWYVGGLNFQIEHHLFPKISHVHYPAISKIVQKHCEINGVDYNYSPTMWKAVTSHWRFMKHLGKKPENLETATTSFF